MRSNIPEGAVRTLQTNLQNMGLYSGGINGLFTPLTDQAIDQALSTRQSELTFKLFENDISAWSNQRKATAYFQLLMKDAGQDIGAADGFWRPRVDVAYDLHTGLMKPNWRDQQEALPARHTSTSNPNGWPSENTTSLSRFYGPPCNVPLSRVAVPWTMKLAWDTSTRIRSVSIHQKNAASLGRIFNEVANTYTAKEISDYGLDLFGGSYNCRKKRGGSTMSTHAWAIAIDFDPQRNQLRWGANRAFLARPELDPFWDIWEKEGWVSLGRARNFDWMHVQAARP